MLAGCWGQSVESRPGGLLLRGGGALDGALAAQLPLRSRRPARGDRQRDQSGGAADVDGLLLLLLLAVAAVAKPFEALLPVVAFLVFR